MEFFRQLFLLLWKNTTYRRRNKVQLISEHLLPLFFFLLLALYRKTNVSVKTGQCHFQNKALPSAGTLPWIQGIVCNSNTNKPCSPSPTPGETPGQFGSFDNSILSRFFVDTHTILSYVGSRSFSGFQDLMESTTDLTDISPALDTISKLAVFMDKVSSFSIFAEMSAMLRFLPRESFKVFDRILCAQPQVLDEDIEDLDGDNNSTLFCESLIQSLENLHPLFTGKLLYTPDTPAIKRVMKEVNKNFEDLQILQQLKEAWMEVGPQVKRYMESSQNQHLQDLLSRPEVEVLVKQRLAKTSWTTSKISQFLSTPSPDGPRNPQSPPTWLDIYNDINLIITTLAQVTECFSLNKLEGLESEGHLIDRASELLEDGQFWAGVVFLLPNSTSTELPPHVTYKIRMSNVASTGKPDGFWAPGPSFDMRYILGGFVYVQDLVEQAVNRVLTGVKQTTGIYVQQMPYPCYTVDLFFKDLKEMMPLFMTLGWIYPVSMIIKGVVYEKEARLKEAMRSMGLGTGALWLSWFISSLVPFLVTEALLLGVLKWGDILRYSDPSVVFFFLTASATATIMQCLLICTFLSKSNMAAACGGLIYFCLYLLSAVIAMNSQQLNTTLKILASFLSSVAFGFGFEYFIKYEEQGVGIQWSNLHSYPVEEEPYSFIISILMLYVDAFIYAVAAWYIEAVFPGEYGIPKPWYFIFHMNYWIGVPLEAGMSIPPPPAEQDGDHIEAEPSNLILGVNISNLVKIYKRGAKLAVNHLNLKFYEGQITSFLGQNGAGKTTTISILTGLFPPTSGTVYIKGLDIRHDMDIIRRMLGVCPQHNVLFDMLTVEEHVWFYGRLKGLSEAEVNAELDTLLDNIGLLHKRHEQTKNLSGGMQRKLSVAIAFVGGSKVIVLDEPTAGVDPNARRGIWDLLLKYRKDRTIILSTHHMDEAELLGDRIAIISEGKLSSCGSLLFLKSHLGSGYYLTVVKREGLNPRTPSSTSICTSTNKLPPLKESESSSRENTGLGSEENNYLAALLALAQHHIPGARLVDESRREAVINLPQEAAKNSSLAVFLSDLDQRLNELGISSYGLSDSSLEKIFLRVSEETDGKSKSELQDESSRGRGLSAGQRGEGQCAETESQETDLSEDVRGGTPVTGWRLMRQQMGALFVKRWLYARRSCRGLFAQIVLPPMLLLVVLLGLGMKQSEELPSLQLQPWMYGQQYTFFSNDAAGNPAMEKLLEALLDQPGFGTKCMEREEEDNSLSHECEGEQDGLFMRPQVSNSTWQVFSGGNWSVDRPSPECQCSTKDVDRILPDCPEGAGGLPPPQIRSLTGDILQNLTTYNMSDYLVKSYSQILKESRKTKKGLKEFRYGGFSLGGDATKSLPQLQEFVRAIRTRNRVPQNSSLDNLLNRLPDVLGGRDGPNKVKVWFNNKGSHAMVLFVNVMNNGLLRASLPPGPERRRHGITAYNHPLHLSREQLRNEGMSKLGQNILISICVMIAMSFVPPSFVLFLIEERVCKAKHLQLVSGVKPILYWLSNFSWDMLNYTVSTTVVVLILVAFQQQSFVSGTNLPAFVLLLFFYGWSSTPLMYPASFVFSTPSTAYVVLNSINLFIGSSTIMEWNSPILNNVFLIFPHYCLGRGIHKMASNPSGGDLQVQGSQPNPLRWDFIGRDVFAMAAQGVIFLSFTVLLQYKFFIRFRPWWTKPKMSALGPEDEDVARERERVKTGKAQSDILTMTDLSKVYKAGRKPDRLCLAIPRGECFGLLGVNGAGKTSTFRMLTGETTISYGEASINHYSVQTEIEQVYRSMGYCPQFDGISDKLTGREHLELHARLRGVQEDSVPKVAQWGVKTMGLMQYADREAGSYSGGNKRKLCTAISLIGTPSVLFLDEPTTGMDPKAKRLLWNCIQSVTKEGRAVVLTSHSMEECEALCNRMGIMVNGRFRCLGSVQHLKNRYGDGYTIIIHLADSESNPDSCPVSTYMKSSFPSMELKELHHNVLHFQLPSHACCLARVFHVLANNYEELGISDFSVSQTTLDQVFVSFAKEQTEDDNLTDVVVSNRAVQSNVSVQPSGINPPTTPPQPPVGPPQQSKTPQPQTVSSDSKPKGRKSKKAKSSRGKSKEGKSNREKSNSTAMTK